MHSFPSLPTPCSFLLTLSSLFLLFFYSVAAREGAWWKELHIRHRGKGLPPDAYNPNSETKPISACVRA